MQNTLRLLAIISLAFLALPNLCFAGPTGGGTCYCGVFVPSGGDEACKQACGWTAPSGGSGESGEPYDYEAERQRQEAERQRQIEADRQRQQEIEEQLKHEAEEARERQAQFDRNKENVLRSMKGITEGELGLKGTDAGGSGLKGLSDTGNPGLREMPVTDSNVVDLRDKKAPYIVDPGVVKGETQKSQTPHALPPSSGSQRASVDPVSEFLFPGEPARRATTDDVKEFLFPGEPAGMDDVKEFLFPADAHRSLFPKNPDKPLINPLREPDKWKAFEEAAKKNIETQTRKHRAEEVIKKLADDPGLTKARDRIVKEEETEIYRATDKLRTQATKQFEELNKRYGVRDFNEYKKKDHEDPAYRQKMQAIVDDYSNKVDEAAVKVRQSSLKKFSVEVGKFVDNHPELKKGEEQ